MGLVVSYPRVMKNEKGQFQAGAPAGNRCPVGTVRIRTRHKRNAEQRAFVKVAEPNVWTLRARHVWELERGPIPVSMGIHHLDGNKLNDDINNLAIVNKAEHLDEHREEFDHAKRLARSAATRRLLRWSTKSATKRTGRPPKWSDTELAAALDAVRNGEPAHSVEKRTGISRSTLSRRLRAL